MAVPGRQPNEKSLNKGAPRLDWTEVEDVAYAGPKPELPATRTVITRAGQEEVVLQQMTHDWWAVVSSMPHCRLWRESDWMFALHTAVHTADAAFCGVASAASELRQREDGYLGTTVESRRKLRIRYVPAVLEAVESATVTDISSRSKRKLDDA